LIAQSFVFVSEDADILVSTKQAAERSPVQSSMRDE
jgi:hypothetical protein